MPKKKCNNFNGKKSQKRFRSLESTQLPCKLQVRSAFFTESLTASIKYLILLPCLYIAMSPFPIHGVNAMRGHTNPHQTQIVHYFVTTYSVAIEY